MAKTKIFVCEVLPCAGDLEVAVVLMDDGQAEREIQLCVPKSCNISKCVGEEIYYEMKHGEVRIKAVNKPENEVSRQDNTVGV